MNNSCPNGFQDDKILLFPDSPFYECGQNILVTEIFYYINITGSCMLTLLSFLLAIHLVIFGVKSKSSLGVAILNTLGGISAIVVVSYIPIAQLDTQQDQNALSTMVLIQIILNVMGFSFGLNVLTMLHLSLKLLPSNVKKNLNENGRILKFFVFSLVVGLILFVLLNYYSMYLMPNYPTRENFQAVCYIISLSVGLMNFLYAGALTMIIREIEKIKSSVKNIKDSSNKTEQVLFKFKTQRRALIPVCIPGVLFWLLQATFSVSLNHYVIPGFYWVVQIHLFNVLAGLAIVFYTRQTKQFWDHLKLGFYRKPDVKKASTTMKSVSSSKAVTAMITPGL